MKDLILHETFYLNNKLSQVYTTFYFEWKTKSDNKSSESFFKSEYGKLFNVKKKILNKLALFSAPRFYLIKT